jgi:acetolactate synthase small subunit
MPWDRLPRPTATARYIGAGNRLRPQGRPQGLNRLPATALPPGGEDTIHEIAQRFQAHILDVSASSFLLESAAGPEEIDRLVAVLQKYGIQEMARTGCVALHRTPEKSLKQSPSLS